jgi:hypothetical protein
MMKPLAPVCSPGCCFSLRARHSWPCLRVRRDSMNPHCASCAGASHHCGCSCRCWSRDDWCGGHRHPHDARGCLCGARLHHVRGCCRHDADPGRRNWCGDSHSSVHRHGWNRESSNAPGGNQKARMRNCWRPNTLMNFLNWRWNCRPRCSDTFRMIDGTGGCHCCNWKQNGTGRGSCTS